MAAWIFVILTTSGVLFHFAKIFHVKAEKDRWDWDGPYAWLAVVLWIALGCVAFASIFVIAHQIFDIVECMTFPEKVALDYLKEVVKSVSEG